MKCPKVSTQGWAANDRLATGSWSAIARTMGKKGRLGCERDGIGQQRNVYTASYKGIGGAMASTPRWPTQLELRPGEWPGNRLRDMMPTPWPRGPIVPSAEGQKPGSPSPTNSIRTVKTRRMPVIA